MVQELRLPGGRVTAPNGQPPKLEIDIPWLGRPKPYHTLPEPGGPSVTRGRMGHVVMPPKGFGNCYRGHKVRAGGLQPPKVWETETP